jgi:lysophospholipase L1-like esterase
MGKSPAAAIQFLALASCLWPVHEAFSYPALDKLQPQAPTNSAVIPVPKDKPTWFERHEAMNTKAKASGIELIYIGDSIVQFFETTGRDVWNRYYAPRKALNLGISGDRTQHVLWRLDNGNLDGISPKLAIVMIGQNNGGHNSAAEIAEGVTAVVQRIRTKLPHTRILLLGIFQRREKPTPEREVLANANEIVSKIADEKTIHFMDINRFYVQADGSIPADLMPDFEHPSEKGYQVWAEAIEPEVAKLMGEK